MHAIEIHYWELSTYNDGEAIGRWFTLNLMDKEEHEEEVKEWLKELSEELGRHCEEYIIGDTNGLPSRYVLRNQLQDDAFDYVSLADRTHLSEEALNAGIAAGVALDDIEESYLGEFDTLEEFAEHVLGDALPTEFTKSPYAAYFDYGSYGRDLISWDFVEEDDHYFQTI